MNSYRVKTGSSHIHRLTCPRLIRVCKHGELFKNEANGWKLTSDVMSLTQNSSQSGPVRFCPFTAADTRRASPRCFSN